MLGVEEIFGIQRNPLGFINYGDGKSTIYRIFPAINLHLLRGFSGIFFLRPFISIETYWNHFHHLGINPPNFNGLSGFGFNRLFSRPFRSGQLGCSIIRSVGDKRHQSPNQDMDVSINGGTPSSLDGLFKIFKSISWKIREQNGWIRGTSISGTLHILRSCWIGPGLGLFGYAAISHQLGKIQFPKCMSTLNAFFLNGYLRIIQVPSSNQTWQLKILTYTYTYIYIYMCILKHTHTDIYIYIHTYIDILKWRFWSVKTQIYEEFSIFDSSQVVLEWSKQTCTRWAQWVPTRRRSCSAAPWCRHGKFKKPF